MNYQSMEEKVYPGPFVPFLPLHCYGKTHVTEQPIWTRAGLSPRAQGGPLKLQLQTRYLTVRFTAQTGSCGKGSPLQADSPTLPPARHWEEEESFLTREDVDMLVPIHVRR